MNDSKVDKGFTAIDVEHAKSTAVGVVLPEMQGHIEVELTAMTGLGNALDQNDGNMNAELAALGNKNSNKSKVPSHRLRTRISTRRKKQSSNAKGCCKKSLARARGGGGSCWMLDVGC